LWENVTIEMVSQYGAASYKVINCVCHLWYQVFHGISVCNIRNNDEVYDIL